MVLMIWSRIPCTMDAIAITVATPMTTPRIVSAERSLLARSWSSAMSQPSETDCSFIVRTHPASRLPNPGYRSLVPQGHDRVQPGGPHRGIDAEHDAHARAEAQGERDRPAGDARRQR